MCGFKSLHMCLLCVKYGDDCWHYFRFAEDEQFREEKGVIIKEISTLEAPAEQVPEAAKHVW